MNNNNKVSFWYSWPVIILALIVFWPIGVFLIIKRVTTDKKTAMGSGKRIDRLGIGLYVMAALMLIGGFSDGFNFEVVLMALLFAAGGFVLQKKAKDIAKEADDVKRYLAVIVNGNTRQLDSITLHMYRQGLSLALAAVLIILL